MRISKPDVFSTVKIRKSSNLPQVFPDDFMDCIIQADCRQVMKIMPEACIDLIVTSPPYFLNKSYETEWTWEEYCDLMSVVHEYCFRVLKPGGYMVVNFGDYFNKDRFYKSKIPSVYPASINYFDWARKAKFDLQATRIWRKQFGRMSIPFVCNHHPRPIFDYEHIWTLRKPDGTNKEFVNDRKKSQRGVLGDGWSGSAKLSNHEAAFPIELPFWAIDVYSQNKTDIVFDPFSGIGTTLSAAYQRQRKFVGVELDVECCDNAYRRLQGQPLRSVKNYTQ